MSGQSRGYRCHHLLFTRRSYSSFPLSSQLSWISLHRRRSTSLSPGHRSLGSTTRSRQRLCLTSMAHSLTLPRPSILSASEPLNPHPSAMLSMASTQKRCPWLPLSQKRFGLPANASMTRVRWSVDIYRSKSTKLLSDACRLIRWFVQRGSYTVECTCLHGNPMVFALTGGHLLRSAPRMPLVLLIELIVNVLRTPSYPSAASHSRICPFSHSSTTTNLDSQFAYSLRLVASASATCQTQCDHLSPTLCRPLQH